MLNSGERIDPCGVPAVVFLKLRVLTEDPGLEERLHQVQDAFVPDSLPHPVHQGRMRDLVEARRDVALHDPLIASWIRGQVPHLGDRVMSPTPRTEPIGTWEEVRLEDRLQHQFQRRLDHPVGDRGDPQTAHLATGLGDHPLPHRKRPETAVLHLVRSPSRNSSTPTCSTMDDAVAPSTPAVLAPLLPRTRSQRHQQERGIGDEIEQVVERCDEDHHEPNGAAWSGSPVPEPRRVTAPRPTRRCSPTTLLAFQHPHCSTCWPPSPCVRLSRTPTAGRHARDYYEASAPPRGHRSATDLPADSSRLDEPEGDRRMVPTFTQRSIGQGGAQLYSGSIATATPQTFTMASPPSGTKRLRS